MGISNLWFEYRKTIFIGIGILIFIIAGYYYKTEYNYKYFKNGIGITIGTTKKIRGNDNLDITYTYKAGKTYGGAINNDNNYKVGFPNNKYYVVYALDDPSYNILINDIPISVEIDIDTIKPEYIKERLIHTSKAELMWFIKQGSNRSDYEVEGDKSPPATASL